MFDFLPAVEPRKLARSPLVNVVVQVRFENQRIFTTSAGAAQIHEALGDRYARLLVEQQTMLTAGPAGVNTEITPQYRLTDLEGDWSVLFGAEHLTLETSKYTLWTEARTRFEEAVAVAAEVARIRVTERIGLRYVNHFPFETLTTSLRDEILGPLRLSEFRGSLQSSISQQLLTDDDVALIIRYGCANNQGTTGAFLLDIDVSNGTTSPFDAKSLLSQLDSFNDVAFRFFVWSLATSEYESMTAVEKG